jgi:hypothetical protein
MNHISKLIILSVFCFSWLNLCAENRFDYTNKYIQNSNFDNGNINGWDITGKIGARPYYNYNSGTSDYKLPDGSTIRGHYNPETGVWIERFIDVFLALPGKLGNGTISQPIRNLPAGKYRFECDAIACRQGEGKQMNVGVYLFAEVGDNIDLQSISTAANKPEHFSLDFVSSGGDITLGLKFQNATANWMAADNFKLYYFASVEHPVDLTDDYINNPNFNNASYAGWKGTAPNMIGAGDHGPANVAEQWNKTFNTYQDLSGLPDGYYRLSAKTAFRGSWKEYRNKRDAAAKLYATVNDKTIETPFNSIWSCWNRKPMAGNTYFGTWAGERNDEYLDVTYYIPDDPSAFRLYAESGFYDTSLYFEVTGGKARIGVKNESMCDCGDEGCDNWSVFDTFKLIYYGEKSPMEQTNNGWTELLINGDCESDEVTCFVSCEGGGGHKPARIVNGVGYKGTRGICVQSSADAQNKWDTQFFISTPTHKIWRAGEQYRLKFRVRAEKPAHISTEAHYSPGIYVAYGIADGEFDVTTEWKLFEYEGTITPEQAGESGMQTIALDLNEFRNTDNNFYFDDISWQYLCSEEVNKFPYQTECGFGQDYKPGENHRIKIDWDAIAGSLGVTKSVLKIYAVLPDGTLDENYKVGSAGTNGWRNAEGAWEKRVDGGKSKYCVRFTDDKDPLALTFVGCMNTSEPTTYTATYKVVSDKNPKGNYVTLEISLVVKGEFQVGDIAYKILSAPNKTVVVDKSTDYEGHLTVPATVKYKDQTWSVIGIADNAFNNCSSLISVELPSSLERRCLGDALFTGCTQLAAVIWNASFALTKIKLGEVDNPNLLFYSTKKSFAPTGITNIVVGENADIITLQDGNGRDNCNFYCPKAFTAKEISYTHNYKMTSAIGSVGGWETIALPFIVQKIVHESAGEALPFANNAGGNSVKRFWLYGYGQGGFVRKERIESNKPYIICMPNNDKYEPECNLAGSVTFSSQNARVQASTGDFGQKNGDKTFVPAYCMTAKSSKVYALNISNDLHKETGGQPAGSVFVRNLRYVSPFEAYMTTSSANARAMIEIDLEETTGIEELTGISLNGRQCIYNLGGQLILDTSSRTEMENVMKELPAGVYIINGKKKLIK